ncbi:tetratricopeptide repeat protein [Leptolyngbya cf. ectocarpi LEGE 11479]|uniref:Tetratricopeptide repeat protein n=1 Tax=Leptolyngbya cf. ectocarpi LEGE 11479 TaxID=1828722 RepID=A0A929FBM3_LEPEC|nr:tetratricopeptide repeat protein [Leptolyngbya ectocarpi]MBE9069262.1 tetratricopeptide repeat protein [Leptolyngbya cf. ectocarpi LEGE 11479]
MALPDSLYVARPAANSFLENLDLAFKSPVQQPAVFHTWGLGGVGKSTLLDRAQLAHGKRCTIPEQVTIAEVKFGDTANTGTPLGVMKVLHSQLSSTVGDPQKDPFYELERRYATTLETLKTKTEDGTAQASDKQIEIVKKYSQLALQGASIIFAAGNPVGTAMAVAAPHIGELGELGASILDDAKGLLNRHQATRNDDKLQALMLNPLLELTKAFVKSLQAKAAVQPVLLMLDFYEKVPVEVDRWLCSTLLGNTALQQYPVRIVSAGRKRLLNKDHWSERHQNDSAVYEQELERFEDTQAREYLQKIGITDDDRVKRIITATRGLPYYLNWVREEYNKGQEPDFTEGAQEIKKVLLRQFTAHETQLVQIVACCRRFDGDLIKHLTRCADLEIPLQPTETAKGRFRWLLDLPFTQRTETEHRFDDVARDVLRQVFYEESQQQFRSTHQALADHYVALADEGFWEDAHISEQYDSEDWRSYQAEALYHQLFANPKQAELQLITRALEGVYFSAEEIVQRPLQAISAEYQEDIQPLIKLGLQKALNHIKKIVDQGWQLRYSDHLEGLLTSCYVGEEFSLCMGKDVSRSLAFCWKHAERLTGLAKFVAYFYQGKYGPDYQQLAWLHRARAQAKEIVTADAPEFSNDLLAPKLGLTFGKAGCYEDSVACFDEAIKYKPDSYQAWYNRSIALRQLKRYENEIEGYDTALRYQPYSYAAWNNRGIALDNLERHEEAIISYDEALKHKPNFFITWCNRGTSLGQLERYEEAIISYDKALAHKPNFFIVWYLRGMLLDKLERYKEAIASYDQVLKYEPSYYEAWANRGWALDKLERYEEAITSYDEALKHKPSYHEVWYNRGWILDELERYEEAISSYDQALKHEPCFHEAWYSQGSALVKLKRYEEALSSYEQVLEHKPDKHEAWYNRGILLGHLDRCEDAIASYDQALKHKPDCHLTWNNRGNMLGQLERYDEAIASYNKVLEIKPDNEEAHYNKACYYTLLGNPDAALENLQQAIIFVPEKYREMAKTDTHFDSLRNDPRFSDLITP